MSIRSQQRLYRLEAFWMTWRKNQQRAHFIPQPMFPGSNEQLFFERNTLNRAACHEDRPSRRSLANQSRYAALLRRANVVLHISRDLHRLGAYPHDHEPQRILFALCQP